MKFLASLNSLRALDALARCGGIRAAAQDLGVVPGAVRQQLAALENHFGVALVNRDAARVTLNTNGQRLADAVAIAFGIISRAAEEITPGFHRYRLRLGVPMPMASDWLMPRMAKMHSQLSSVDVDIIPVDVCRSLSDMMDIDALIVGGEYKPLPDIDATPFMDDAFGPVHAPHLELDPGPAATPLAVMESLTALVARDVGYLWDDWFHESGQAPIRFSMRVELADLTLALSAARNGLGVTIAPFASVERDIAKGILVAPAGFVSRPVGYRFCCRQADRDQKPIASLRTWLCEEGTRQDTGAEKLRKPAE
jgi:DNA-binding transcriptional LysR family regulator